MRILIQRVTQAKVSVGGSTVGAIGRGLLVFVGISPKDRNSDAKYLANKLLNIRLWADQETGAKSWSSNVVQNKYDVLLVSQFTLYCVPKGHKPDFHFAMTPEQAEPFYAEFVDRVKKEYKGGKVENGVFGADMQVELTNDGPVTISLDTDDMDFSKENEKEDKMKNKFKKKSDSTPITDATATSPISSPTSIGNISASPTSVVSSPSTSSNTETIPSQNVSSNKSPLSKTVAATSPSPSSSPSFSSLVGNTSLIYLRSLSRLSGCSIYGKAEFENPGGSIKDRPANRMIQDAEARGELVHGEPGWIIEGTAGNTGIGLTLAGAARGYRTIIVMAANNSQEKKDALRSLGAILIEVPFVPFSNPNNYVHVTQRIYQRMKQQYDDSIKNGPSASTTHDDASTPRPARVFLADQWSNPSNRTCHYETTGPEIWSQTLGKIDAFCCGVGTGGSLNGIGRFLKSKNSKITIGLIDPNGSCLKSYFETGVLTATPGSSISEGIGQGRVCQNLIAEGFRPDVCLHITDQEALPLTYQLLEEEGLSIGSSSAINVTGALRLAQRLGPGHTIVTLLADSGMRYQSKLYNPKFLLEKNLPIPPWLNEQHDVIRSGMKSQVQQWSHEVMVPVDEKGQPITNHSSTSVAFQPIDSSSTGSVSNPSTSASPPYAAPPIDLTTQGIEPNPGPACETCGYENAAASNSCGNPHGCSPSNRCCNPCKAPRPNRASKRKVENQKPDANNDATSSTEADDEEHDATMISKTAGHSKRAKKDTSADTSASAMVTDGDADAHDEEEAAAAASSRPQRQRKAPARLTPAPTPTAAESSKSSPSKKGKSKGKQAGGVTSASSSSTLSESAPPVDVIGRAQDWHVYRDASGEYFDGVLIKLCFSGAACNQRGNHYWLQQILESVSVDTMGRHKYALSLRWGVIYSQGQSRVWDQGVGEAGLASAIKSFKKEFRTRTGRDWSKDERMDHKTGKYGLITRADLTPEELGCASTVSVALALSPADQAVQIDLDAPLSLDERRAYTDDLLSKWEGRVESERHNLDAKHPIRMLLKKAAMCDDMIPRLRLDEPVWPLHEPQFSHVSTRTKMSLLNLIILATHNCYSQKERSVKEAVLQLVENNIRKYGYDFTRVSQANAKGATETAAATSSAPPSHFDPILLHARGPLRQLLLSQPSVTPALLNAVHPPQSWYYGKLSVVDAAVVEQDLPLVKQLLSLGANACIEPWTSDELVKLKVEFLLDWLCLLAEFDGTDISLLRQFRVVGGRPALNLQKVGDWMNGSSCSASINTENLVWFIVLSKLVEWNEHGGSSQSSATTTDALIPSGSPACRNVFVTYPKWLQPNTAKVPGFTQLPNFLTSNYGVCHWLSAEQKALNVQNDELRYHAFLPVNIINKRWQPYTATRLQCLQPDADVSIASFNMGAWLANARKQLDVLLYSHRLLTPGGKLSVSEWKEVLRLHRTSQQHIYLIEGGLSMLEAIGSELFQSMSGEDSALLLNQIRSFRGAELLVRLNRTILSYFADTFSHNAFNDVPFLISAREYVLSMVGGHLHGSFDKRTLMSGDAEQDDSLHLLADEPLPSIHNLFHGLTYGGARRMEHHMKVVRILFAHGITRDEKGDSMLHHFISATYFDPTLLEQLVQQFPQLYAGDTLTVASPTTNRTLLQEAENQLKSVDAPNRPKGTLKDTAAWKKMHILNRIGAK